MQELAGQVDGRSWRPAEPDVAGFDASSFLSLQPQSGADDVFLQSVLSDFLQSSSLQFPSSAPSPPEENPRTPQPDPAAASGDYVASGASLTPYWLQEAGDPLFGAPKPLPNSGQHRPVQQASAPAQASLPPAPEAWCSRDSTTSAGQALTPQSSYDNMPSPSFSLTDNRPVAQHDRRHSEDAYTSPDRSLMESDPGPLPRGWSGGPALSHSELSGADGDRVGEKARARDRNRDAQRRFRQRQREQAASSMRMVADMTARLEAMALRQSELELRNQVLEHTVRLSTRHAQELSLPQTGVGGPELDRKQQQLLMLESTHVWSRVMGKSLSDYTLQYCCNMPFGAFMDEEFPALIHRLGSLLEAGGWDPDTPAGRELCTIVTLRHKEEYRNALFSRWFVALTAWNEEIMRDPAVAPPASSFWANILEGLRLEPAQIAVLANARHTLLRRIIDIRNARAKIVLALGTAAVQPEADLRKHGGVKRLHESLEDEREAVLDFLYKAIDDCLTPAQEAYLDCSSCPWWPDLWHMTGLLAAQKMPLLAAGTKKPPQEKDVPAATAPPQHAMFEMLRRPQLALGQGLILKRGLASVPIAEEALWQVPPLMPSIALLRGMTSLDVMCGAFWDAPTRARYPLPKRTSKLSDKAADAAVRALTRRSAGSNSFVEP